MTMLLILWLVGIAAWGLGHTIATIRKGRDRKELLAGWGLAVLWPVVIILSLVFVLFVQKGTP